MKSRSNPKNLSKSKNHILHNEKIKVSGAVTRHHLNLLEPVKAGSFFLNLEDINQLDINEMIFILN